jgi:short-subunit dehydrogenase
MPFATTPKPQSRRLVLQQRHGVEVRPAIGFDGTDLDDDLRLIDLNCRSTVHLAKLVIRDMVARGDGRVLVTASIAAKAPGPFQATYAASKAFVHSFAEAIRHELNDTGVTVTSLMPGPTDTDFFGRADMEDTQVAAGPKSSPEEVAARGFEALMAGHAQVVAGSLKDKLMTAGSGLVPDPLAAEVVARQTRPGSA